MRVEPHGDGRERGFATVSLLVLLLPVLLLVGAYLRTMTARNQRLSSEVNEEKALLGCESGFDMVLFQARQGGLRKGDIYRERLPSGSSYEALAEYLGDDGQNNDGDGDVDEPDEDVFRIRIDGAHAEAQRRIAVYLGFTSTITAPGAAITMQVPPSDIRIGGSAAIDGRNYNLAGTLSGSGDASGLTITPPGTTADLLAQLTTSESGQINGAGGAPSLSSFPSPNDLDEIVAQARNAAQIVITNGTVTGGNYGDAIAGPQFSVFRDGDLRISGNARGAGLLVVTGNLVITGTFAWTGVVVVLGDLSAGSGTAVITGALMLGANCSSLDLRGTLDIQYSTEAIELARRLNGRYVAYNGWQELSTRRP